MRQALRNLRESGLVKSQQAFGTIVERPGLNKGYVHRVDAISDLFPAGVETGYSLATAALAPLPAWALTFDALPKDQTWLHVHTLR